jgi:hypothetical protein
MSVASAEEFVLGYQWVPLRETFKRVDFLLQLQDEICGIVDIVVRNVIKDLLKIVLCLLR